MHKAYQKKRYPSTPWPVPVIAIHDQGWQEVNPRWDALLRLCVGQYDFLKVRR
jgi:hypothetical protein